MKLFKFIIIGAAVSYGIDYLTKKKENGRSVLDDLQDNAPEYIEKAKKIGKVAFDKLQDNLQKY
ncbi:MAG: YtxH domain-containing protein [Pelobium sp.]